MFETNANLSNHTVLVATRDQVSCDLGDEAAILSTKNNVYYGLNPVGTRIWRLLQEPRRIDEIREAIVTEYDVTAERAEIDLMRLLEEMLGAGLVELSPGSSSRSETCGGQP